VGCKAKADDGAHTESKPGTAASSTAALAPSASASAAPTTDPDTLPTYPARKIPKGPGPTGAYLVDFSVERVPGDENHTWREAVQTCEARGKSLCTEAQWLKACNADKTLGSMETWTLTSDHPGAAVRGGEGGCSRRSWIALEDRNPRRVGLCCDRAIAIATPITEGAFREEMNERILKFEHALNHGETVVLAELYNDNILFSKKDLDQATLIKRHVRELASAPDLLFVFDRCAIKQLEDGLSKETYADCTVGYHKAGRTRGGSQRIAWTNDMRIAYYGDAKDYKKRETKERVRGFITSTP
jgi:hypothetical protein